MAEEPTPSQPPPADSVPPPDAIDFDAAFGEPLADVLNIDRWREGGDLQGLYQRLQDEVAAAVQTEDGLRATIRDQILPRLRGRVDAPADAGCYQAEPADLEQVHRKLLFNGGAQACDGTSMEHDTLPVTITQIGVCLASYQGDQFSLAHRLFQQDLRVRSGDLMEDLMTLLDQRNQRGSTDADERNQLSTLAQRGIMTYGERAVLAYKATAPWRIGHGIPAPYELLRGSGSMMLLRRGIDVLYDLLFHHQRWVFVPSSYSDRRLLTIAQVLPPLGYMVVQTAEHDMLRIVDAGHYSKQDQRLARDFCETVGPQIAMGVFRASAAAPPRIFYGHIEHVHEAALLAMADSVLQEHRGFPLLIDVAHSMCSTTFGNDIFNDAVQSAYADADAPFRFLTERQTRT